jgi:acyl-CoA synthetase (AMP-forming)/AMP-acid ligase II
MPTAGYTPPTPLDARRRMDALPRPVQGSSQSRGENVDPTEVEGLLLEDPRINHVAVVGLPDEWLAEVPVAFVIKQAGAVLTEQDVLERRRNCIARFKIPRRVFFVDAFPMTGSGRLRSACFASKLRR